MSETPITDALEQSAFDDDECLVTDSNYESATWLARRLERDLALRTKERDQQERFKWKANMRADAAEAALREIAMMAESLCEPSAITEKARALLARMEEPR